MSLAYHDPENVESQTLEGVRKDSGRVQTLDFRGADFLGCSGDWWGMPGEADLKGPGAQQSQQVFKDRPAKHKDGPSRYSLKLADTSGDQLG